MIRAYIVEHDIGFAPNPFYGVCTLACCKPVIRRCAQKGEWIVGIGSGNDEVRGKLVYAMQVEDDKTFDEYWESPEFRRKRPIFNGSLMQAQGDNVYHKEDGKFISIRSRHTHSNPLEGRKHFEQDTQTDRVLISRRFVYLGQNAVEIRPDLIDGRGRPLNLDGRGTEKGGLQRERKFEDPDLERKFVSWLEELDLWGYQGDPNEWRRADAIKAILKECY